MRVRYRSHMENDRVRVRSSACAIAPRVGVCGGDGDAGVARVLPPATRNGKVLCLYAYISGKPPTLPCTLTRRFPIFRPKLSTEKPRPSDPRAHTRTRIHAHTHTRSDTYTLLVPSLVHSPPPSRRVESPSPFSLDRLYPTYSRQRMQRRAVIFGQNRTYPA